MNKTELKIKAKSFWRKNKNVIIAGGVGAVSFAAGYLLCKNNLKPQLDDLKTIKDFIDTHISISKDSPVAAVINDIDAKYENGALVAWQVFEDTLGTKDLGMLGEKLSTYETPEQPLALTHFMAFGPKQDSLVHYTA